MKEHHRLCSTSLLLLLHEGSRVIRAVASSALSER